MSRYTDKFSYKIQLLIADIEYVLNQLHGYGKDPRKPLLPLKEEEGTRLMAQFKKMIDLEVEYSNK